MVLGSPHQQGSAPKCCPRRAVEGKARESALKRANLVVRARRTIAQPDQCCAALPGASPGVRRRAAQPPRRPRAAAVAGVCRQLPARLRRAAQPQHGCSAMVKAYLRYQQAAAWGVIASAGGCAFDATGKLLATACLDRVGVWSLKQGAEVRCTRVLRDIAPTRGSSHAACFGCVAGSLAGAAASDRGRRECPCHSHRARARARRRPPGGWLLRRRGECGPAARRGTWSALRPAAQAAAARCAVDDVADARRARQIRIWNLSNGECTTTLHGHKARASRDPCCAPSMPLRPSSRRPRSAAPVMRDLRISYASMTTKTALRSLGRLLPRALCTPRCANADAASQTLGATTVCCFRAALQPRRRAACQRRA